MRETILVLVSCALAVAASIEAGAAERVRVATAGFEGRPALAYTAAESRDGAATAARERRAQRLCGALGYDRVDDAYVEETRSVEALEIGSDLYLTSSR
jgi:hypothetical protein